MAKQCCNTGDINDRLVMGRTNAALIEMMIIQTDLPIILADDEEVEIMYQEYF